MKRVIAACLFQTLHFQLKEGIPHADAVLQVKREVEKYKAGLKAKNVKYKIDSEIEQPDGSIILVIRRQNNLFPIGNYLE